MVRVVVAVAVALVVAVAVAEVVAVAVVGVVVVVVIRMSATTVVTIDDESVRDRHIAYVTEHAVPIYEPWSLKYWYQYRCIGTNRHVLAQ